MKNTYLYWKNKVMIALLIFFEMVSYQDAQLNRMGVYFDLFLFSFHITALLFNKAVEKMNGKRKHEDIDKEISLRNANIIDDRGFNSTFEEESISGMNDKRLPKTLVESFRMCKNVSEPTPIQKIGWLPVCKGRDTIALAPTGSGKTLTYALPIVSMIKEFQNPKDACVISALILVPTRELAIQICKVFTPFKQIKAAAVYGGASRSEQVDLLCGGSGVNVVVGTPGRVLDLLDASELRIGNLRVFGLDECDKMLDMGFEPQISRIVQTIRSQVQEIQTLLFSATFPKKLQAIIESLQLLRKDYVKIQCTIPDKATEDTTPTGGISSTIKQIVQVCAEHKKPRKLIRFIEKVHKEEKAAGKRVLSSFLVFCTKIKTVKFVENFLKVKNQMSCSALYGGMPQHMREKVLSNFKAGKSKILVATDVAGRGIDVKGLNFVVNYDFPSNLETYTHRIGRTGRANNVGTAFSFFTRNFVWMASDLINLLRNCNQQVDPYLIELEKSAKKSGELEGCDSKEKVIEEEEEGEEGEEGEEEKETLDIKAVNNDDHVSKKKKVFHNNHKKKNKK